MALYVLLVCPVIISKQKKLYQKDIFQGYVFNDIRDHFLGADICIYLQEYVRNSNAHVNIDSDGLPPIKMRLWGAESWQDGQQFMEVTEHGLIEIIPVKVVA